MYPLNDRSRDCGDEYIGKTTQPLHKSKRASREEPMFSLVSSSMFSSREMYIGDSKFKPPFMYKAGISARNTRNVSDLAL